MKTKRKTKPKAKGKKTALKTAGSKAKKKKLIATGLAVGTAGIIGFFGWQIWKNKKQQSRTNADIDAVLKQSNGVISTPVINQPQAEIKPKIAKPVYTYNNSNTTGTTDFPLKKGSKGALVKTLQQALIARYGKSTLPRFGADGDFGSETINALKKLGYAASIDESTFNVITAVTKINPASVGKELYTATSAKNYSAALDSLKKLKSTEEYSKANEVFKLTRINGVHKTIVNGLLDTFTTGSQKDAIKQEFLRMGLQYDGNKWALSGLDGLSLVTIEPTTVWVNAKESVNVPARMVLGSEISRRLDYTLFENKGKYFLVNTKSVNYL
jgi:hypothetical protein